MALSISSNKTTTYGSSKCRLRTKNGTNRRREHGQGYQTGIIRADWPRSLAERGARLLGLARVNLRIGSGAEFLDHVAVPVETPSG